MAKQTKNSPQNSVETTGHEWDGIKEFNNPLPLWWLWIFIACVVFAIGYAIYYPTVPPLGQKFVSASNWTQYKQLEDEIGVGMKIRAPYEDKLKNMTAEEIQKNPELYTYAIASGKSTFGLHCVQCHGASAGGIPGYPSHLDNEWIWGGTLADILYTIRHGIRDANDPETRDMGPMMAFGKDGILTKREINDVLYFVNTLSRPHQEVTFAVENGKQIYADNCASCHMDDGSGSRELGAPSLNNHIWLYGGDTHALLESITNGRAGMMPEYGSKLSDTDIRKLALYVHSLGGGEAEPAPEPVVEEVPAIVEEAAVKVPAAEVPSEVEFEIEIPVAE